MPALLVMEPVTSAASGGATMSSIACVPEPCAIKGDACPRAKPKRWVSSAHSPEKTGVARLVPPTRSM